MKLYHVLLLLSFSIFSQNAAVSSYLNPKNYGKSDVRIREVRVPSSGNAICTYWCTLGYWTTGKTSGYGGIQWTTDNSQGPKNYIYSQWNDYSTTAYKDPYTKVTLFTGEGTGVKSVNNSPSNQWGPDYWHVTADRIWSEGNKTYFAFFSKNGKTGIWHHIMTWSTPEPDLRFSSSYCFIEDWRGDGAYRESQIRKGWDRMASDQDWVPLETYNYSINTGDIAPGGRSYNKRTNWCGGIKEDATGKFFYMGAGGNVSCTNNAGSNHTINRTETSPQEEYGILKVSNFTVTPISNNTKLVVTWKNDSTTVPQYSYSIAIKEASSPVLSKSDTIPQKRSDTLDISNLTPDSTRYTVTLAIVDIFDGKPDTQSAYFGGPNSLKNHITQKFNHGLKWNIKGNSIIFNKSINKANTFSLFNLSGQLLFETSIHGKELKLNNPLPNGSYLWILKSNDPIRKGFFTIFK